jgi:hypothetical protein
MAAVVRAGRFSIWLLVVNFNFSFSIGLQFWADVFQIPQQRQALLVSGNFMRPFITIISFFISTLCFSQVTTSFETVIVDSGKYEFKLQAKKDTADYSKAFRILSNQVSCVQLISATLPFNFKNTSFGVK